MKIRILYFSVVIVVVWVAFLIWHNYYNGDIKKEVVEDITTVEVVKPIIDLKYVPNDTIVSAVFEIINTGKSMLNVEFVNPVYIIRLS